LAHIITALAVKVKLAGEGVGNSALVSLGDDDDDYNVDPNMDVEANSYAFGAAAQAAESN
jgi:hypothetical protein